MGDGRGGANAADQSLQGRAALTASLVAAMLIATVVPAARAQSQAEETAPVLPDAPGVMLQQTAERDHAQMSTEPKLRPCERMSYSWELKPQPRPNGPCEEDPIQMIVGGGKVAPLTPTQKGELAVRNVIDPFNAVTILADSAIYVGANSHSAYGPGLKGFGKLTGYSYLEDMQGEFFGVYAIPVLAHEDPRYHRMPDGSVGLRFVHALAHTVVTRHDDGTLMPNYATLMTYPISAELSNLYVPGVATNAPSTARRILLGYATNPASDLVAEFLPDVAKRIHVRIVFVQQILNQVVVRGNGP